MDLIHRSFTGIETRKDVLWFNPCLPEELERLRMEIRYRGHSLEVEISQSKLKVSSLRCAENPIKIGYKDSVIGLKERDTREFSL